jgi:hypothetical protein
MSDRPEPDRAPAIPKPPSREDIERISEAQELITDDWTGDGGRPADEQPAEKPA